MSRRLAGTIGIESYDSTGTVSGAIRAGDFVFISGLLPRDEEGTLVTGDITHQTHAVMKSLETLVTRSGCTMNDVAKCTVWLAHAEDLPAFNAVYVTYFDEPRPARTTLRGDFLEAGARLQIEVVCHKPRSRVYPHTYG